VLEEIHLILEHELIMHGRRYLRELLCGAELPQVLALDRF
jgi:hypothetical protein